jgi:N-acetylneuraminate synthase
MASVIVVAEIGINHAGSIETALRLIDAAKASGADYVKFQKREPRLSVPEAQWNVQKSTPWGIVSYIDYKLHMEFGDEEFAVIDAYCKDVGIGWFLSVWDIPSAEFAMRYDPPMIKVPSAKVTDMALLKWLRKNAKVYRPETDIIFSTGMCTMDDVDAAVEALGPTFPTIMHCTSTYPCPPEELNLSVITSLRRRYPNPIGYSGHETGLAPTLAAVALGVIMVERHITLDRTSWGTDQAASVEPQGFARLVKDIRLLERSLGDGIKKVEPGEVAPMAKLRG